MNSQTRKIFNFEDCLDRFGGDESLFKELANIFVNEPQFSTEKLDKFVKEGLITEAASMIHQLKGISGTLGAEILYDQCIRAENVLKNKLPGDFEEEKLCLYAVREETIAQISTHLNK